MKQNWLIKYIILLFFMLIFLSFWKFSVDKKVCHFILSSIESYCITHSMMLPNTTDELTSWINSNNYYTGSLDIFDDFIFTGGVSLTNLNANTRYIKSKKIHMLLCARQINKKLIKKNTRKKNK